MTKPDLMIPFKVTNDRVKTIVSNWLAEENLTATEITPPEAAYVPFWVMSGVATGLARTGTASDEGRTIKVSATQEVIPDNEIYTNTRLVDANAGKAYKGGEGQIRVIPAKRDQATMLNEFTATLKERAFKTAQHQLATQNIKMDEPTISGLSAALMLVPVYQVSYSYGGEKYPILVTGDSGKVIGKQVRPDRYGRRSSSRQGNRVLVLLSVLLLLAIVGGLIYVAVIQ